MTHREVTKILDELATRHLEFSRARGTTISDVKDSLFLALEQAYSLGERHGWVFTQELDRERGNGP